MITFHLSPVSVCEHFLQHYVMRGAHLSCHSNLKKKKLSDLFFSPTVWRCHLSTDVI